MALTNCPECKAQISTKADACPACGARIPRTSVFTKILGGIFVVIGVVAAIDLASRDEPTSSPPATSQERADLVKIEADARAKRAEEFAANRKAIIGKIQALSRAGKWDDAYQAANAYADVDDSELHSLMTTANEKIAAAAAAKAKAEARKQGVSIGMTKEQVLGSSWGRPQKINSTHNRYGTREQWVYGGGNYLYFEADRLTSIQTGR